MISLVFGLGNIGKRYEKTRHNVGFDTLDRAADMLDARRADSTGLFESAVAERGGRRIVLARPLTYVNRSGWAAQALLHRYELRPEQMLVVVDDFNLPLGRLRFRRSGSDGGHNGLASIIETLETTNFPRLRLGIGSPPEEIDSADFVLATFAPDEIEPKEAMIATAAEAVVYSIDHRFDEAMSKYNANPA